MELEVLLSGVRNNQTWCVIYHSDGLNNTPCCPSPQFLYPVPILIVHFWNSLIFMPLLYSQTQATLLLLKINGYWTFGFLGESITLIGFGSFSVATRAARTGHNPQTGKEIKIAEKKVVKFKVGKTLKESACIKEKVGCGCGCKTAEVKKK